MPIFHLFVYINAYILLWLATGLIVSSASRFSRLLRLSSSAVSFFVLGMLTSTPEIGLGVTSVINHQPELFVGDLIGGIVVIFFFIIPLLAIFGNGLQIGKHITSATLFLSFAVFVVPVLAVLDMKVTMAEGVVAMMMYCILFLFVERKKGIFNHSTVEAVVNAPHIRKELAKIAVGIGCVFLASIMIVRYTVYYATSFNISPFFLGLFVLALGTNLPELSIAIRATIAKEKNIALGDYVGSAAANTFLFGLFTILAGGEVVLAKGFYPTLFLMVVGFTLFYLLARTKNGISKREGFFLLAYYLLFIFIEKVSGT